MIFKLRRKIAYSLSIMIIALSFGMIKPDFTGESNIFTPTSNNQPNQTLHVDEDINLKNT